MKSTGERKRQGFAGQAFKRLSKGQQQALLIVGIVVLFALNIYLRR